jgi:radical SAM superfamily enzyme YgiQ (UPF0313 family)
MKRALLLQLAAPRTSNEPVLENDHLAAGYLASAYARDSRRHDFQVEIIARAEADYAGDAALLQALMAKSPDVIGLTLYCWNISRSLYLARRLKSLCPELFLVAGGPEVTPDNEFLLDDNPFDSLVIGEGEITFPRLLDALAAGTLADLAPEEGIIILASKPERSRWQQSPSIDLARLTSPYLDGLIPIDPIGQSMRIETSRGCKNRCAYCFYSRFNHRISRLSQEYLEKIFTFARANQVREIFLADPDLSCREDFIDFLHCLKRLNPDRQIEIHSELRAEQITPDIARLLAEAGLRGVEAGLQSTNPRALKAISRKADLAQFVAGVRAMQGAGLKVLVDMIIGLPFDSAEDVKNTANFIRSHELHEDVQVFNLSLLPGTRLRTLREKYGYRHQKNPPYAVLRNQWLSSDEIFSLFQYTQQLFETGFDPIGQPNLEIPASMTEPLWLDSLEFGGCHDRLIVRSQLPPHFAADALAANLANFFTLWVRDMRSAEALPAIERLILTLHAVNPHTVFEIIIEPIDTGLLRPLAEFFERLPLTLDHYFHHYYYYHASEVRMSNLKKVIILPYAWENCSSRTDLARFNDIWFIFKIEIRSVDQLRQLLSDLSSDLDYWFVLPRAWSESERQNATELLAEYDLAEEIITSL